MPLAVSANLPDLTSGNRARDAEGILKAIDMVISAVAPDWTDRSENDPGVAMMQVVAYLADHLHWQVDRALTDALLPMTTRRSAAVMLARMLGYDTNGAAAAVVTLQFTVAPLAGVGNLTIPKATRCQATFQGVAVNFETDADLVIQRAGPFVASVTATEGITGSETLGTANGEPYQKYVLAAAGVIKNRSQNSLVVSVGADAWTEVASFAKSKPTDKHYVVLRDHNDKLTVLFGDDARGTIPINGKVITAAFRTGGGILGNLPSGTIKPVVSTVVYEGNPVVPTVTHTAAAMGGAARETTESVKLSAPPYFASQDRAVTSDDYDAIAKTVSGVLHAQAVRSGLAMIECRVVPSGWTGTFLTAAMEASVRVLLETKRLVTDTVRTLAAIPVRPKITLTVTARPGYQADRIRRAVLDALKTLYAEASMTFGNGTDSTSLFFSDMVAAVDGVEGVNHVDVDAFTRVPLLTGIRLNPIDVYPDRFHNQSWDTAAGEAVFVNAVPGASAVEEEWTIEFLSPLAFSVRGSASGMQAAIGAVGDRYTADKGQVSFDVNPGATAMAAGNRGRFRTSPAVGNILVRRGEHPIFLEADASIVVREGR
mgnify:CR=1 FL=1